jgi:hypothetical protein
MYIKAWIDLCFLTLATFAYFLAFEILYLFGAY